MNSIPDCSSETIQCLGKAERFMGKSRKKPVVTARDVSQTRVPGNGLKVPYRERRFTEVMGGGAEELQPITVIWVIWHRERRGPRSLRGLSKKCSVETSAERMIIRRFQLIRKVKVCSGSVVLCLYPANGMLDVAKTLIGRGGRGSSKAMKYRGDCLTTGTRVNLK
jgi:hypothetical protein